MGPLLLISQQLYHRVLVKTNSTWISNVRWSRHRHSRFGSNRALRRAGCSAVCCTSNRVLVVRRTKEVKHFFRCKHRCRHVLSCYTRTCRTFHLEPNQRSRKSLLLAKDLGLVHLPLLDKLRIRSSNYTRQFFSQSSVIYCRVFLQPELQRFLYVGSSSQSLGSHERTRWGKHKQIRAGKAVCGELCLWWHKRQCNFHVPVPLVFMQVPHRCLRTMEQTSDSPLKSFLAQTFLRSNAVDADTVYHLYRVALSMPLLLPQHKFARMVRSALDQCLSISEDRLILYHIPTTRIIPASHPKIKDVLRSHMDVVQSWTADETAEQMGTSSTEVTHVAWNTMFCCRTVAGIVLQRTFILRRMQPPILNGRRCSAC